MKKFMINNRTDASKTDENDLSSQCCCLILVNVPLYGE